MSARGDVAARRAAAQLYDYRGGAGAAAAREVALETPVQLMVAGAPFAVMMASPADLEDFAYGFAFTEGMVDDPRDLTAVEVAAQADHIRLALTLAPAALRTHLARKRVLSGRTGCGLCGVEDVASLPKAARVATARPPSPAAVGAAIAALHDAQPLNERTRAAHAAAWCDARGAIVAAREDVGRHNALDKLIGALLRAGADPREGFIVVTSRCSFEMVTKAARFGAGALVALSAPTSLALDAARAAGLYVIAIARREGALAFDPFENLGQDDGAAA